MTVGYSIDFETATLSTSASKLLNLGKQLEFIKTQYTKLKSQKQEISFKKVDTANDLILEDIHNFLQHELQFDYSGNIRIDFLVFLTKLEEQRSYHHSDNAVNHQKICVLQHQCDELKMELNEKDFAIRQFEIEQEQLKQEFQLTFSQINQQQIYESNDEHKSISESIDCTLTEIMTLSVAVQTDKFYDDESLSDMLDSMSSDMFFNTESTAIQTELSGNDLFTMDNFNEMMIQKMEETYVEIPISKGLVSSPQHCLEDDFNEIQSSSDSSSDTVDNEKNEEPEKKQVVFGNELFSRTQQRMKRRKQYDASKNERMRQKEIKMKKFQVYKQQEANPYRCTKAKRQ